MLECAAQLVQLVKKSISKAEYVFLIALSGHIKILQKNVNPVMKHALHVMAGSLQIVYHAQEAEHFK